jgi:hypothetical protein
VPPPEDDTLRELVEALVNAGAGTVSAILLYGSRVQGSSPDRWSAYDFFLVTDSYSGFFKSLCDKGHHGKPPWVLTFFSFFLPPNIISFGQSPTGLPQAKVGVVSSGHFQHSLGPWSRDHFLKGRAVQKLSLVWARGQKDEALVYDALRSARNGVVHWVRPSLKGPFDLARFTETMLRVSYRGEIRPESSVRVDEVVESQGELLRSIAKESLDAAEERGFVLREGEVYRWARTPGRTIRFLYGSYFTLSKIRATARWFKYVVTFEGWIDYIIRKIQRRAGFEVKITKWERRLPVIFLWPKLFKVLAALKRAGDPGALRDEDREIS